MPSSRSLRLLAFKSVVLGLALLAGGCDRQSGDSAQPPADAPSDNAGGGGELSGKLDRSRAGEQIPEFTVSDTQGRTLPLRSLRGGPLLVNLWATWCAPCVVELPMLNEVARMMDGKLKVLAISQDMNTSADVAPFLEARKLDRLEPWVDSKSDLTLLLGAESLPTTILYDAEGREVWRYIGGNDWTSEESKNLLDEGTK